MNGYPGNVGDVIVSNGPTTTPVWAPLVSGMEEGKDGYQIFPGGFIIQWGTWSKTSVTPQAFPIPFPTACLSIIATCNDGVGYTPYIDTASTTKTHYEIFGSIYYKNTSFGAFMESVMQISPVVKVNINANWMAFGY